MLSIDDVLAQLNARLTHPTGLPEILKLLRIPREERASFKRVIETLVRRGDLLETRAGLYGPAALMDVVVGRITVNPRGFAFVEPERPVDGIAGDVFVAGAHLNEAIHGDRVAVRVERRGRDGRAEGRIVRILERATSQIVGRFDVDPSGQTFVVPFDRRLVMDIQVPRGEHRSAAPGDMVTVEIVRWPTPTRPPLGRVIEVLGPIEAPGVDTQVILRKYSIRDEHDDAALEEARRLGTEVRPRDLDGRTDFRPWPTVTIDGEHARDFDDAITVERLADGHIRLGVHIADVSHYVAEGSALDTDALERGTSVYFPERAVHMFPADLATGLCSLNPHVDRLVQSCVMDVDAHGDVVRSEMHDGVIHSDARMTYTEVNAILTDRDPGVRAKYGALVPKFELMQELFEVLNARRRRRGSIDFDLPEAQVVLNEAGAVEEIVASERNVAHRLIEEFMLLANETVADYLDGREAPALYRVHEKPDPVKVAEFEEFVATLGYSLGSSSEEVRPRDFQRLAERLRGTPEERPVAFLMLRTLQRARYDPANLGHFGLAASSYTHFTSPIRRYPDLVVHRALRDSRQRKANRERLRATDRGHARSGAAHVRARAARRRRRA